MDSDQYVVWITTRRIREGSYEDFRKAWRPTEFPEGMLRAYECFSEDSNEVVGISTWDSLESRERYRTSEVEAARRRVSSSDPVGRLASSEAIDAGGFAPGPSSR